MATEIKMPQLSDTMSSGKIIAWNKKEGDTIRRGDILAEVETDKANLEIEAFHSGTLVSITTPAGSAANVGQTIALIGNPEEAVVNSAGVEETIQSSAPEEKAPTASEVAAPAAVNSTSLARINGNGSHRTEESSRIKASPLARKLAEQSSVNLSQLQGSGPNGRIIKQDVEKAQGQHTASSSDKQDISSVPSPSAGASSSNTSVSVVNNTQAGTGTLTPLSKMRATIAGRMLQAVHEAPHFFTTVEINMSAAKVARETLKLLPDYKGLGINHMIIKAAAYALEREPVVNAAMREGNQLYQPAEINIGIITAVPDGLLIPVIKNTNLLNLKDITFEARAAIDRARAGRPTAADLSGGTFSISNMGMFDVENFTAIINPGQGGILAVSAMKERPIVENGQISVGLIMKVTLSVDHRIIDGVTACGFLKYLKKALENPVLLLA